MFLAKSLKSAGVSQSYLVNKSGDAFFKKKTQCTAVVQVRIVVNKQLRTNLHHSV